jgi:hypothetical protein
MNSQDDSRAGRQFRFCIDRGGTFTDIYAEVSRLPAPDCFEPCLHAILCGKITGALNIYGVIENFLFGTL